MATAERVLKNIVNLNTTKIISIEPSTRLTTRFGDPFELEVLKIHVEPYVRMQHLCPICQQACQGYDHPLSHESSWRANNLNGVIVELLYNPARVFCPEHGVHRELIPWADGNSRFTPEFNNEITWMAARNRSRTSAWHTATSRSTTRKARSKRWKQAGKSPPPTTTGPSSNSWTSSSPSAESREIQQ